MKRLTYNNLMKLANRIVRTKHYDLQESIKLARNCFDKCIANPGRTAESFVESILTKEEYEAEYNQ